jgi:hypothetical protein
MDKFVKASKEIETLERQRKSAEDYIKLVNSKVSEKRQLMADYYNNFFTSKKKKDFVCYDRFPNKEALDLHASIKSDKHPLNKYGNFNVKELAEIIKLIFQYQKQKEYKILTIGKIDEHMTPVYGDKCFDIIPQLFFVIGKDITLNPYMEYNGVFLNRDNYLNFESYKAKKDIIALNIDTCSYNGEVLDIECLTGHFTDKKESINYHDYLTHTNRSINFDMIKNIYPQSLNSKLHYYKGVKDTLDFAININDSFIAKILISICIYKKNNNITELTNEDYAHIFNVLYGEKVNIAEQVEKDIPKTLKYIPHIKTN